MTDTTIPEIKWPGYVPPPEREGMRLSRIEMKQTQRGDYVFNGFEWVINCNKSGSLGKYPIAIYEPAPILCPECGAEMKVEVSGLGCYLRCAGCNSDHREHFTTPYRDTKAEALAAAECLRGLWEKKQEGKVL